MCFPTFHKNIFISKAFCFGQDKSKNIYYLDIQGIHIIMMTLHGLMCNEISHYFTHSWHIWFNIIHTTYIMTLIPHSFSCLQNVWIASATGKAEIATDRQ